MSDQAAIQARDIALFTLLYGCGLRIAEALSLNVRDAPRPGDDGPLRVVGKGSKERIVPVLPVVREAIAACLRLHPGAAPDAPLFLGARGKRLDAAVAQRTLRLYRQQNGLPEHATPHALRHSFATHLLAGGRTYARSRICWDTRVYRRRNGIPAWMRLGCLRSGGKRIRGREWAAKLACSVAEHRSRSERR